MPQQKKRALAETDTNVQPPAKKNSTGKKTADSDPRDKQCQSTASSSNDKASAKETNSQWLDKQPNDLYICIDRHVWDFEAEYQDKAKKGAFQAFKKAQGMWPKVAVEHADWKWTMMVGAWKKLCETCIKQSYCDPDNFDMYIWNDFYGYAINDMIEETLIEFTKEFSKKKEARSLQNIWIIMSTLGHWLSNPDTTGPWMMIDSGEHVGHLNNLIGRAFASTLHLIDQAGHLKPDSEFRDLELVMSLYLLFCEDVSDICDEDDDEDEKDWREIIVAYAAKGKLDLVANGRWGVKECLETLDSGKIKGLRANKTNDRWKWKTSFTEFTWSPGLAGGALLPPGASEYDITKWTRTMRAKYNFDNADPLAEIPEKDLKEGNIMLA